MPRRWLQSADVLIDEQGRLSVALPEELLSDGRLKVDASGLTLQADVIDIDVEALIDGIAGDKTLSDIVDLLLSGGDPVLTIIENDLCNGLLSDGISESYLACLPDDQDDRQNIGTSAHKIEQLLRGSGDGSSPFWGSGEGESLYAELCNVEGAIGDASDNITSSLADLLSDGSNSSLYDAIFDVICLLQDPNTYGSWLERLVTVLEDVWDSGNHALRVATTGG